MSASPKPQPAAGQPRAEAPPHVPVLESPSAHKWIIALSVMLGTDNAMFHAPSIWRELEFAYVATRLRRRPVSAEFLARAALVEPWRWLGEPRAARVAPGMPVPPLVLRLPPDDPAYQVVTRTTEHLIVRVGPRSAGPVPPP